MTAAESHKPPCRICYKQSYPTIAVRLTGDLKVLSDQVRTNTGLGSAEIIKSVLQDQLKKEASYHGSLYALQARIDP